MAGTPRAVARLAWAALGLIVALTATGGILLATRAEDAIDPFEIPFLLGFLLFAVVGALILTRQPGNRVGKLYLLMGASVSLTALGDGYASAIPPLPGREWFAWLGQWAWVIGLGGLPFVLLLFPDGRFASRRWRVVGWVAGLGALSLGLGNMLTPRLVDYPGIANPVGVEAIVGTPLEEGGIGWLLFLVAIPASAAAMVVRFRRAHGVERIQLKWLAASAATVGAAYGFLAIAYEGTISEVAAFTFFVSILGVPVATGIAILKHRLFDIDVVINRALVYGALAAFIGVVYVALVVGVGALLDLPSIGLQIAATAVVAVVFHPLRERLQHLANRLVFGRRSSPYEVLSGFSERVAETYATEDVLPRMARIIQEGTAAARADVWLRVGDELVREGTWPTGEVGPERGRPDRLPLSDGALPDMDADRTVPVRHRDELLGAVAVTKRPGEALSPAETKLLEDLAHQAGLVLRNVRLTAELRARLGELSSRTEQLRRSRERIVETQDAERRRLERNIHDGAQQHLVALAVKLRLARTMAVRDPDRARSLLQEARGQTARALDTLRDLAGGIYPPALTERGVVAALAEQTEGLGIAVEVDDGGLGNGRLPAEVEAAVYFSALEALQNAAKHAGASRLGVRLDLDGGALTFSVSDDGRGFEPASARRGSGLQNLADRLEALGGTLEVDAAPGAGATIRGRIPVPAGEVAAT